ncbi:MAG: ATP-binding cassette domain-containing protein, partial [Propionibacteriaceae bacterium]|nr:ATP-binding cassette domain-containing protein [Propionibacteriaceae bacterium]
MAHLLNADGIGLTYPTTVVFEAVTCGLDDGDRVGIVGRNGDGKSSLLNMLSGRLEPTSGQVTRRNGLRVGYLGQGEDLWEMGTASVVTALFGSQQTYQWASDPAKRAIVEGLLAGISLDQRVAALSGGERRRVALAALLVGDWDVLALDEPTNHLDLEAIWWLAEHLKTRMPARLGGLLVVTHDRWFLDEVVQTT